MQYIAAVIAVASAAMAAPLAPRDSSDFTLISARSGSPVHLQGIAARGLQLWVGGNTAAYCPDSVQGLDCSGYKNITAFGASEGNPTGVGMDTTVPGGQLLYIAPGGSVKYTQAHSGYMPPGSVSAGFKYEPSGNFKSLNPVANGSTGFLACPSTAAEKETGPWQVYADVQDVQVPSGSTNDCYGFDALASDYNGTAAWQYA